MFDLSWSEILVIGTAAIIFIGPKELPGALRTAGQWMAKARSLAREFQNSVDDMIRESELEKIKTEVDKLGTTDLQRQIENTIDPQGEINRALNTPAVSLDQPKTPELDQAKTPEPVPAAASHAPPQPAPEPKAAEPPSSDAPQKPAA